MQFYSYMSIRLPLSGFALLCWKICKRREGLDGHEPAVTVARARELVYVRVQANGNNVIVLINWILLAYYAGEDLEFQRELSCLSCKHLFYRKRNLGSDL